MADDLPLARRIPVTDRLRQQHGFVHGGVLSYAADNALTFAGGSALGPAVVTAEFKINYLRPARGDLLIAKATVLHAGKRQAVSAGACSNALAYRLAGAPLSSVRSRGCGP